MGTPLINILNSGDASINSKGMREVVLYFPNNVLMAEFILSARLSRVETNTLHLRLSGFLTEQQIVNALLYYEAELSLIKPDRAV